MPMAVRRARIGVRQVASHLPRRRAVPVPRFPVFMSDPAPVPTSPGPVQPAIAAKGKPGTDYLPRNVVNAPVVSVRDVNVYAGHQGVHRQAQRRPRG